MNTPEPNETEEPAEPRALQLRLLPPHRPLVERLGIEFFRRIPARPGVYLMTGEQDRLLYVGKAKSLRARLASYRHLHPERASRKVLRLVGLVRSITWELCDSPEAALLRENELLRRHKPRFNVMNVRPEHYLFLGVSADDTGLSLRLTKQPRALPGETLHGAFKSLGRVRAGTRSLVRLLWSVAHPAATAFDYPRRWMGERCPESFTLAPAECGATDPRALAGALRELLTHGNPALIEGLEEALRQPTSPCLARQRLMESDLETLRLFHESGPVRNHRLRNAFDYPDPIIPQDHLDDLLVLAAGTIEGGAEQHLPGVVAEPGLRAGDLADEEGGDIAEGGDPPGAAPADPTEVRSL